jgi:hypothetical protein
MAKHQPTSEEYQHLLEENDALRTTIVRLRRELSG